MEIYPLKGAAWENAPLYFIGIYLPVKKNTTKKLIQLKSHKLISYV